MTDVKIVGISGLVRSGKDTLAELFIKNGYFGFSLGDFMRNRSRERHKNTPDPISVAHITETANWLRNQHGADVALQDGLKEFEAKQRAGAHFEGLVLFSVRAPAEVDWILAHGGELIWVETSDEIRHQRMLQHLREGELPIDLQEFKRQEDLQAKPQPGIPAEAQMNITYVKQHATKTLINNGNDVEAFKRDAETLIQAINEP